MNWKLLEMIQEMDDAELLEFVEKKCEEDDIDFDVNDLDGSGKQPLYEFLCDNFYPEFQAELHGECQPTPGFGVFVGAENQADIEEIIEHEFARKN